MSMNQFTSISDFAKPHTKKNSDPLSVACFKGSKVMFWERMKITLAGFAHFSPPLYPSPFSLSLFIYLLLPLSPPFFLLLSPPLPLTLSLPSFPSYPWPSYFLFSFLPSTLSLHSFSPFPFSSPLFPSSPSFSPTPFPRPIFLRLPLPFPHPPTSVVSSTPIPLGLSAS